jgi:hypothetical protein
MLYFFLLHLKYFFILILFFLYKKKKKNLLYHSTKKKFLRIRELDIVIFLVIFVTRLAKIAKKLIWRV